MDVGEVVTDEAFVPPFAIGNMPETCDVREISPDNCEVGRLNADRVVRVLLLVAVIFVEVPVVFAALFGISALTKLLNVG